MEEGFSLEDLLIIVRRRIIYFLVPVIICAPLGILAVMLLPSKYTAKGTILVESQQIPEEMIQSTVNSYAQERIQTIRARVMTRERLLLVADKHSLFPDTNLSESERVEHMRQNLQVDLMSASRSAKGKKQPEGTIAFTVSYSDTSPKKAFQIANEFMTLFLTEDVKARSGFASNTTEFFRQESQRLRSAVEAIEDRITTFKQENANALPEHRTLHMQQLERAKIDLANVETSISLMEEERRSTEMQLASYLAGAGGESGAGEELARLRAELAALRADKTEAHPDVRALRQRISSLEAQFKPSNIVTNLQAMAQAADDALRQARLAETLDPEEIARLAAASTEARAKLSDQLAREAASKGSDYLATSLQARIDTINNRITGMNRQSDELRTSIRDLEGRIAQTPAVERALSTLTRDYDNLQVEYQDLQRKQSTAVIAENLEENNKAEKFSILEPAVQPDSPSTPDRPKLSALAVMASIALGGFCAIAAEFLMASVRGREHLTALMGEPPIATVPYIAIDGESRMPFKLPFTKPRRHSGRALAPAE